MIVRFAMATYTVLESVGAFDGCIVLNGEFERNVTVNAFTLSDSAGQKYSLQ